MRTRTRMRTRPRTRPRNPTRTPRTDVPIGCPIAALLLKSKEAMSIDIDEEIERLYTKPLSEFIDARNQLARTLRKDHRDAAELIKKLAKPSVSAWAVNQAYWRARDEFDAMLDAGDELRAMQQRALGGGQPGDLQTAMAAQRQALAAVMKRAEAALKDGGHGKSNAILRRVSTTLEALATYGRAEEAPRAGRLCADVPAPGFDALAAIAERNKGGPPHLRAVRKGAKPAPARPGTAPAAKPAPSTANDNQPLAGDDKLAAERAAAERARRQARVAVDEARAAMEARERALGEAKSAEKTALDRVYAAEKAVVAAQEELVRAVSSREETVKSAERAKVDVERAQAALEKSRTALESAQKVLTDLGTPD